MAKRSDNPLSPFNKNWRCPIDWTELNKAAAYSSSQSKVVNNARKQGREISLGVPVSEKAAALVGDPRRFHVDELVKALTTKKDRNGKNQRTK
jgi:hypothetical protein